MIGAAITSAAIGASSANKAADAQENAANNQLALESRIYDETTQRFQPFYDQGLDYSNALRFELLGGDRPTFGGQAPEVTPFTETTTQPNAGYNQANPYWNSRDGNAALRDITSTTTRYRVGDQIFDTEQAANDYAQANPSGGQEYQGFQATPGYQFSLDQGRRAIDASAASRGSTFSGANIKAQQQFGIGLADQEYGNYLNRLTGGAAGGQAAAGQQATAGANYATGAGQAYGNLGNAQAAGSIGVGNALTGGLNNLVGVQNYQNLQGNNIWGKPQGGQTLFGPNAWG